MTTDWRASNKETHELILSEMGEALARFDSTAIYITLNITEIIEISQCMINRHGVTQKIENYVDDIALKRSENIENAWN